MNGYERVKSILEEKAIDAVIIGNGCNMRYISGFSGATGYLYLSKNKRVILTDFRYTIQAGEESREFQVIEVEKVYEQAILTLLKEDGAKTLGFEGRDMRYDDYLNLQTVLKGVELVPLKEEITQLRNVKEDWELARLEAAEAIGDKAFSRILDVIKPGMTEISVAAHLEFYMKESGAERLSFESIVASGVHSAMPHAVPTEKKIESGDFVTMDFGCVYQGYCSDMTRTIVVGEASRQQKKIYQLVLDAQLGALEYIKAGRKGMEVDRVARDIIYRGGFEGCFGHGLGHSVGLFIHENPRLSEKDETALLPNMVETIEPGIYIRGFGGVRIEDMVQVTESGHINYTNSPKQLIEL